MAFADLLVQKVQVFARSGRTDRFGQPKDSNPSQITGSPVATYPCRINLKSGGLEMEERNIDVFARVWLMFVKLDASVNENDVVRVIGSDGSTVVVTSAIVKDVETINDSTGPHHKEILVWERTGPNPARVV